MIDKGFDGDEVKAIIREMQIANRINFFLLSKYNIDLVLLG